MKTSILIIVVISNLLNSLFAQNCNPYPGTLFPDTKPLVFAKGIVSTSEHEFGCSFSPDGKSFYFTRAYGHFKKKQILVTEFDGKSWSKPKNALPSFMGETYEPHVSNDGKRLYFMGMKFIENEETPLMDLFYAEKAGNEWKNITHLGKPFNPRNCMFVSTTINNTIYTTNRSGEGPDIVFATYKNKSYSKFKNPGMSINTEKPELYPFIAPDESYLLFNRITNEGKRLFVCFKGKDNNWSDAIKVPLGMESGCPMVSPDGCFFFFCGGKKFLNDIYWVSSKVFLNLNPFDE